MRVRYTTHLLLAATATVLLSACVFRGVAAETIDDCDAYEYLYEDGDYDRCTPLSCGANEYVVNHECVECPEWLQSAAGSTLFSCDYVHCDANQYVANHACVACPPGTTNVYDAYESDGDTSCDATLCAENERVENNACVSCPAGTTNAAGDDASGSDTSCTICAANYYVSSNTCTACPAGTTNAAGDDASGSDTSCDEDDDDDAAVQKTPPLDENYRARVEASVDVRGYSAAEFVGAVQTSFRRGVALVLDGVDAEDVVIDSVADVDAAANSLRIRRRRVLLLAVANAAVRVDFRIFTDATQSSSSSSSISLAEQLSRSVNDGSLVVALTSSGLTNVTGISVVSLQDVDGDEKSDRLGQSAVAGIASGCVAFVAVSIFCAKRNAFRRGVRIARLVQEHQQG